MLSVAAALLLHSDLKPRYLVPLLLTTMAIAAAASQQATPFPLPYDAYRPASTLGIYWVQPVALASIIVLAIAGRRRTVAEIAESDEVAVRSAVMPGRFAMPALGARSFALGGAATAALAFGALSAAYVSGSGPFRAAGYFDRGRVLGALPADFPVPPLSDVESAGAGSTYPYRVEWQTPSRTSEVAGLMREQLDDGSWRVVDSSSQGGAVTMRSARSGNGSSPLIAQVRITPHGDGSRVTLEFSPLPSSLVPGYDDWLRQLGIVVHNIDPNSPEALVTPTR
jgi:hypothetical protein